MDRTPQERQSGTVGVTGKVKNSNRGKKTRHRNFPFEGKKKKKKDSPKSPETWEGRKKENKRGKARESASHQWDIPSIERKGARKGRNH